MLQEIKEFYEKTKIPEGLEDLPEEEYPITFIKVFHKSYPRFPIVNLPSVNKEGEFETLLSLRESCRVFSDNPVKLEEISKILGSCKIVDNLREPEKRTYPSGGARFPVELYLASFNVEDLKKGIYHYNFKRNVLEVLLEQDLTSKKRNIISPYLENPAASIIFTSVIARSEVKYGPRAYVYSLIESGHMGQNIHLACAEIGLGSCSVSGFVDETVRELLDLTESEIPIYSIGFGRKKTQL